MMIYEIFKDVVTEKFMDFLPDEMQGRYELCVRKVTKVNTELDAISLNDREETYSVSPTLYINDMYKEYCQSEDLDAVLDKAAFMMVSHMKKAKRINLDFDTARENIIFQLINTENNCELLKNVPHRQFNDLSFIYRWVVDTKGDELGSIIVTNELAENLQLTEEELYELASENTCRLLPATITPMNEVIRKLMASDGMPEEMIEAMLPEIPEENGLWVIGNKQGVNGAVSMLYDGLLANLADKLGSDLYVLPSSIHETIAVSSNNFKPEELFTMVKENNETQVMPEDKLTDNVYFYDREARTLTATA